MKIDIKEEHLIELIEKKLTMRSIAKEIGTPLSNVRYWLNKYGLKTKYGPRGGRKKDDSLVFRCKCGETDPKKFYGNKNQKCSKCQNSYNISRGNENKTKARLLLGGKCKLCGFDKYLCALDFHHTDPSQKDPGYKHIRYRSWSVMEKEIQKCILVCRNCHSAIHAGIIMGE